MTMLQMINEEKLKYCLGMLRTAVITTKERVECGRDKCMFVCGGVSTVVVFSFSKATV